MRLRVGAGVVAAALLASVTAARAGTFDERGRLSTGGAAFAYGFDGPLDPSVWRWVGEANDQNLEDWETADAEGLEGPGAAHFGGDNYYLAIGLDGLADPLDGRRVEVRLWYRAEGTDLTAGIRWMSGDWQASYENPDQQVPIAQVGELQLLPTGRATTDGWVELSSGPVDYAVGGALPMSLIELYDPQAILAQYQVVELNTAARVAIDALEVLDLGPAAVPGVACRLPDQDATCGDLGFCLYARCVDSATVYGAVPPVEAGVRDDYLARRAFEMGTFSGVRVARHSDYAERMEALGDVDSPRAFWEGFSQAYEVLKDGHASPPAMSFGFGGGDWACLNWGAADLMPEGGEAPLVFASAAEHPIGGLLEAGDVVRAIDGLAPEDWMAAAGARFFYGGDPRARSVQLTPSILSVARRAGSVLEIARCATPDAACSEDDLDVFEIDLAERAAGIWDNDPPQRTRGGFVGCDFRFLRAVEDDNVFDFDFAGWVDDDDVRVVQFNSVPYSYEAPAWYSAVGEGLDTRRPILLDERMGGGGSYEAPVFITGLLFDPNDVYVMEVIPWLDPFDADLRDTWRHNAGCSVQDATGGGDCGGYFRWGGPDPGGDGQASTNRVAVLMGLDASGNDYLSDLLARRHGPTRLFGPGPTYGAFGYICSTPSYLGETSSGSLQCADSMTWWADEPPAEDAFQSGVGVMPDQRVLQRQSDTLRRVDTLLEVAREWLAAAKEAR